MSQILNYEYTEILIFPVGLYGCKTWYLILREEHGLRVFDNLVMIKIFQPKMENILY